MRCNATISRKETVLCEVRNFDGKRKSQSTEIGKGNKLERYKITTNEVLTKESIRNLPSKYKRRNNQPKE